MHCFGHVIWHVDNWRLFLVILMLKIFEQQFNHRFRHDWVWVRWFELPTTLTPSGFFDYFLHDYDSQWGLKKRSNLCTKPLLFNGEKNMNHRDICQCRKWYFSDDNLVWICVSEVSTPLEYGLSKHVSIRWKWLTI